MAIEDDVCFINDNLSFAHLILGGDINSLDPNDVMAATGLRIINNLLTRGSNQLDYFFANYWIFLQQLQVVLLMIYFL